MTARILFVDDDADILRGFSRGLRKQRARWDMVFAQTGAAALDHLRGATFDVVISDMRMPELDGAALLAHVRGHDPTTIRMILSGFADHTSLLRAQPVAHEFLDKPCDLGSLAATIERACAVRALFTGEPLRSLVRAVAIDPSSPHPYHALAWIADPSDHAAIAAVLERDPAVGVRLLELANMFAPQRRLTSICQVLASVGLDGVTALAIALHACEAIPDLTLPPFSLRRGPVGESCIVDLVHAIGKAVIGIAGSVECPASGTSHAEVGAYLLALWGFPLSLIESVAFHRPETDSPSSISQRIARSLLSSSELC